MWLISHPSFISFCFFEMTPFLADSFVERLERGYRTILVGDRGGEREAERDGRTGGRGEIVAYATFVYW